MASEGSKRSAVVYSVLSVLISLACHTITDKKRRLGKCLQVVVARSGDDVRGVSSGDSDLRCVCVCVCDVGDQWREEREESGDENRGK